MTRRVAALGIVFAAVTTQPAIAQTIIVANAQGDIVLPAASASGSGKWVSGSDATAAAGKVIRHPDAGAAKILAAAASPENYFDVLFEAEAGKAYRLWVHGRADANYWGNDSVFVQFSRSVDASGNAIYRIGSTSGTDVNLESCSGCGVSDWMWQDNGYGSGVLGPVIRFSTSGTQQIRVQTREDGLAIDQIVLSPSTYLTAPPAATLDTAVPAPAPVPPPAPGEIVLAAGAATNKSGKWVSATDATALGGSLVRHADAGAAKVSTALAAPSNYFEMTFNAVAGTPYRLWVHGRADGDLWANDSVHVQFSGSVTSSGSSSYRIGTTSSTVVNLEECSGAGLSGWMWQDNGYGQDVLGPAIYFATTGTQTIRVQTREDGLAIDRILLSPALYLTARPTAAAPAPAPAPEPVPTPVPTTGLLKVLDWNIHHGVGTDGVYNLDRVATAIAKASPDVVSLNEVERFNWWGNEDQPARFAALLKAKTGKNWYYNFATRGGAENGQGNLLLTTYPIETSADHLLSYDRSVAHIQIIVNGRRVSLFSTHLDDDSSAERLIQMAQLNSWSASFPQSTILAGDFNFWPGAAETATMTALFRDTWAEAKAAGTAIAYSGNEAGNTRSSRIDYVWVSKAATALIIKSSQVFDLRDSSGIMPSDHRPIMTTFEVR